MHFVQIYPVSTLSQEMRKYGLFALVLANVSEPLGERLRDRKRERESKEGGRETGRGGGSLT